MAANSTVVDIMEDSAMRLVSEIATQYTNEDKLDEKNSLIDKSQALDEAGDRKGLISLILSKSEVILLFDETDVESSFQVIMTLTFGLANNDLDEIVNDMIKKITSSTTDKINLRLKILISIFNLSVLVNVKLMLLQSIFEYAHLTNLSYLICDFHEKIGNWIDNWDISNNDKSLIYRLMAKTLEQVDRTSDSLQYLIKYLTIFQGDVLPSDVIEIVTKALVTAIKAPVAEFNYRNALYESICKQNLGPADSKLNKLVLLLQILCSGSLKDYADFISDSKNSSLLKEDSININSDSVLESMKLLSLCNLCAENSLLSYDTVAKELSIPINKVELWIIKAIGHKLIDVTMNQSDSTITVTKATFRKFGKEQWVKIRNKLSVWHSQMCDVLNVLEK